MVYVINIHGHPLMPCSPAKARRLLKDGKAKAIKRTPFTIKLLYKNNNYKQDITLGVDAGSKHIGLAAVAGNGELFAAEVTPRNNVVDKLSTRREFRRTRRNRKRRHRKARFNNRVHNKHKGWLAPSVEVKIQEHITSIKRICTILPVTKVIVETAEFDQQLIKALEDGIPAPVGEEYQQGEMLGSYNIRQYILRRDNYTCQCCGKHGDGVKLHVHHNESRKTGGDAPDNQITLCEVCHKKFHKGEISLDKLKRRGRLSTRDMAFMGIMRKTLMDRLYTELSIPVEETKGYITKYTRVEKLHLPKTHINDALAIAFGPQFSGTAIRTERQYTIKPVRHHNRQLHRATILKGNIRKSNQAPKYVYGFRLFDKVLYNGIECFVWGRRSSGNMKLSNLDGTKVKDGVNYKKLTLIERSSNYLII